ncbi:MAG TPA: secondary thiamine-phosphate synthase enzyme YjbQ [Methanospirillum sp.]|uniref:secondary thiamine-phosphate synthase enzyme YjbQ n=1 Tax=Methanospirillum sp. TaxID=45200 RepID=UPI002BD2241C|nr:secondary thiamine-phosphate synthase enzyme YjbQ [Methanospirillum sp.]HOJ96541.1 secondary thiamine-phosphate synthase enzyme YjbQ [Methanospirillum sp.]HOL41593.1 secondary thiamine-phosphate synthase enzyme YjbQ [Methanospirillum sp.]HPP79261.1 secondary thiamine-phosphate synthase enzyme YjbQ [Methanospirillum sp.]
MKWTPIEVKTGSRTVFVDITGRIDEEIRKTGIQNGICFIVIQHTTAGLTINENADPDVTRDILVSLSRLVPATGDYRHAEGNSDAHLKASLMGFSLMVPVMNGRLARGTWQGIYVCEFDGPRTRQVLVGVQGEEE